MTEDAATQLVADAIDLGRGADLYEDRGEVEVATRMRQHSFWCLLGLLADDDLAMTGRGHLWYAVWSMAEAHGHQDTLLRLVLWKLREAGHLPAEGEA